ncbi:MAG: ABC transporter substrate-binding protein [Rhodospirillales bacterium]|jgi:branched-chain amino acid transport system substrate-binding protein|nr:ABC transporter substrate-binding protein [Rhodospirillales bacterium]
MFGLFRVTNFFVSVPLVAAALLLVACESSRLTPWRQGEIGPPILAAPAPPAKDSEIPSSAGVSQGSGAAGATSQQAALPPDATGVPSLAPLLNRPGVAAPIPSAGSFTPSLLPPAEVPRVGVLLPLTGPQAAIGKSMLNAAQLALFDFAGDRFELVVHDTEGSPDGAAQAMAMAIGDGASLVLGPLLAPSVRAVSPAARAAGVPVIAFSSDHSVAGDGVFTMGFFPDAEVRRVVAYARSRGVTRFAAMVPDDAYGSRVIDSLRAAVDAAGGVVARIQFYDPHTQDFASSVRQLARYESRRTALERQRAELEARGDEISKRALERLENLQTYGDLPFEALLIAGGGKRLQAIGAHLPFFDIDPKRVRMLGTGQWDVAGIGAEPALLGGWFAAPTPTARIDFEEKYIAVYGEKPFRLATLAYDATALAAVLAGADEGPQFGLDSLTRQTGFFGRDGIFRFKPEGLAERGLAVLEVERRGFRVIDSAPEAFPQAMF